MEFRAYMEGIWSKWWIVVPLVLLGLFIGRSIGNSQRSEYTATTTLQINDTLLTNNVDPTGIVKLSLPKNITNLIVSPALIDYINKHYPRLSRADLTKNIVVTADTTHQVVVISVTDISIDAAANIADYVAQNFVKTQNAGLALQLDYYQNALPQRISSLQNEINKLNTEIQQLTPPPVPPKNYKPPTPEDKQTLATDQYQLDTDERELYNNEQALNSLTRTRSLFSDAYIILRPATDSGLPVLIPLSLTIYELIGLGSGLLAAIILICTYEYFSPYVRHKGELQRLVGLPVMAELPKVFSFDLKRELQLRRPVFSGRVTLLRVICASIGAYAMREKGHTVLLTSPRKKRHFAAILGTYLARNGYRTLLIDLDFRNPTLHQQIKRAGSSDLVTYSGIPLTFISGTTNPDLFLLPAIATVAQNIPVTSAIVMDLMPELQQMFDTIIIDAPPLDRGEAHLLAKRVKQTLLLVKKRQDSLKTLNLTRVWCEDLKLNMQSLLLS